MVSNRSMIEINHDECPYSVEERTMFLRGIVDFIRSGDPEDLPRGLTWFGTRHHSDPCPLGSPPKGWDNRG